MPGKEVSGILYCNRNLEKAAMQTAKRDVEELLKNLPDDSTIEDIQYHLYFLEKIR